MFWKIFCLSLPVGLAAGIISSAATGMLIGLIVGGPIGGLLFMLPGIILGMYEGVPLGALFGAFNGLLLGMFTIRYFFPLVNSRSYHRIMGVICVLASLCFFVLLCAAPHWLGRSPDSDGYGFVLYALPGVGLSAWWASQRICDWYQKECEEFTLSTIWKR